MLAATLDQAVYIYETQPLRQATPDQGSFERAPLREDGEEGGEEDG